MATRDREDGPPYPPNVGGVGGAVPTPAWLPLLRPDQMRLPGPLEAEGFVDLEGQWRDFWSGQDDADE